MRALASFAILMSLTVAAPWRGARAELVLSQLVVELSPGDQSRSDIEVFNNGSDRIYVSIQPREIIAPGTASESDAENPDPEKLGLLVSPARLILEPGQRRLIRIAAIAQPSNRERVYRVTVKPVVGELSTQSSGLKLLIGYDLLVLVRPDDPKLHVSGAWSRDQLTLRNDGNVSVELVDGKQCDPLTKTCSDLPGGRLYAGAEKTIPASSKQRVEYKMKAGSTVVPVQF